MQQSNFDQNQMNELYEIFKTFMNPQSKMINMKEIITGMKTLNFFENNKIISSILYKINDKFANQDMDFPLFINELNENLVKMQKIYEFIMNLIG